MGGTELADRCTGGTGAPIAVRRGRVWLLAVGAAGADAGAGPAFVGWEVGRVPFWTGAVGVVAALVAPWTGGVGPWAGVALGFAVLGAGGIGPSTGVRLPTVGAVVGSGAGRLAAVRWTGASRGAL
ncbi:hypothetical protein DEJ49_28215 [Streptomyces venezuelae]|uniref:Uncharacterized protein n=1 Tax=Streptomyces venezuelae TaxID=54571 RepID=A0A5P2CRJ0_STRVZ|nr:hypothetical protein [Streptomyces venezuelae]QES44368.1 hypothetical protein DEJ49_28215 [Streptomyces venezuelae]